MLYRSARRLCRAGAPVEYLGHSASFHSIEKIAPLNPGIKDLGVFVGLAAKDGRIPLHSGAYSLAHLFTVGAAIVVSNGLGLAPGLVDAARQYLDWDKTQLGTIRGLPPEK